MIEEEAKRFEEYLRQLGYVKPIRCKDCVHWVKNSIVNFIWCEKMGERDYCSMAEVKHATD